MKVTRLIIAIGLVVLTGSASGQLTSDKETMFLKHRLQVAYLSEETTGEIERSINLVGGPFEPQLLEEDLCVESWMVSPFESVCYEEEIWLESWMAEPFSEFLGEEELSIESWMKSPFLIEEELVVEEWMTTFWK